jgi:ApaG protein
MTSKISEGVTVMVETYYQPNFSNVLTSDFMFAYRITIINNNRFPIKLRSRYWNIFDSVGTRREVNGDGVVGIQPTIAPKEEYQYTSGCNLKSEFGKMYGHFTMENLLTHVKFNVSIPSFELQVPFKLN